MDSKLISNTLFKFTGKEKIFVQHVYENIETICEELLWGEPVRVEREFSLNTSLGRVRVDIMIWHKDGSGTIIECKAPRRYSHRYLSYTIGQLLHYGRIAELNLKQLPRLVLCSPEINKETAQTIKRFNLPIGCLQVDGDRCFMLS